MKSSTVYLGFSAQFLEGCKRKSSHSTGTTKTTTTITPTSTTSTTTVYSPTFVTTPEKVVVKEGDNITLHCDVDDLGKQGTDGTVEGLRAVYVETWLIFY